MDDGLLPDVLAGGCVGNSEAPASRPRVETVPDDRLVVIGEHPRVAGPTQVLGQALVVGRAEGVEVEARALLNVGRISVDEHLLTRLSQAGQEVHTVEPGDVDALTQGRDSLDALNEGWLVETSVNTPPAGLVQTADGAGSQDAGAVGAVEEEGGEPQGEVIGLPVLVGAALVVPLLDSDGGVLDEVAEGLSALGAGDGAPQSRDTWIDVVEVDVLDNAVGQQAQSRSCSTSVWLGVAGRAGLLGVDQVREERCQAGLAARVAQRRQVPHWSSVSWGWRRQREGVARFLSSTTASQVGVIASGELEARCWPGGADPDRRRRERLPLVQLLLGLKDSLLDSLGDPG